MGAPAGGVTPTSNGPVGGHLPGLIGSYRPPRLGGNGGGNGGSGKKPPAKKKTTAVRKPGRTRGK